MKEPPSKPPPESLGALIFERRVALGLSLDQLSPRAQLTPVQLANLEADTLQLEPAQLARLAFELGATLGELASGTTKEHPYLTELLAYPLGDELRRYGIDRKLRGILCDPDNGIHSVHELRSVAAYLLGREHGRVMLGGELPAIPPGLLG